MKSRTRHFIRVDWWLRMLREGKLKEHPVSNSFTAVGTLLSIVLLVSFGLGAREELQHFRPGVDPVKFVNDNILIALAAIQLARFFVGQNPALNLRPYMHLPVRKWLVVFAALVTRNINHRNLSILSFIVPFWLANIVPYYAGQVSFMWLVGLLMVMFFLESLFWMLKLFFLMRPLKTSLLTGAIAALLFVAHSAGIFQIGQFDIFGQLLLGNAVTSILLPIFVIASVYVICDSVADNVHVDDITGSRLRLSRALSFPFLEERYPLIALQVKSIMRNRLFRQMAVISLAYVAVGFAGISFVPFRKLYGEIPFIAVFLVTMSLGVFFVALFVHNAFGWDGPHLPVFLTKDVPTQEYVSSKWALARTALISFAIVCLPCYALLGRDFILLAAALDLYLIGVSPYLYTLVSLLGFVSIYPGITVQQLGAYRNRRSYTVGLIPVAMFFFPIAEIYLSYLFATKLDARLYISVISIAVVGLLALFFGKRASRSLVKMFLNRKYRFFEG